eukprot:4133656-Alexandrium_andersonii.AAC.1
MPPPERCMRSAPFAVRTRGPPVHVHSNTSRTSSRCHNISKGPMQQQQPTGTRHSHPHARTVRSAVSISRGAAHQPLLQKCTRMMHCPRPHASARA